MRLCGHEIGLGQKPFLIAGPCVIEFDYRSLVIMRETGCPVVFDATHSVQQPGGLGNRSGGQREFVPHLVRAACAVGVAGLFIETHPDPSVAMSDAATSWPLDQLAHLVRSAVAISAYAA